MSERNKAVVLEFIDAMSNADPDRAAVCLAADATTMAKGFAKVSGPRDRATMLATMGAFKELVPTGLRVTINSVIADEDRVAVEFDGDAVLSNGSAYCNQYCMVFTMENGLIKQNNEYFCTLLADNTIGPLLGAKSLNPA